MKSLFYFISFCASLLLVSCGSRDTVCTDLGVPLTFTFSYTDGDGRHLFAGENPRFSTDELMMYRIANGVSNTISFSFSNDKTTFTAQLLPAKDGQFFVQLEPATVDTLVFTAVENEADPCRSLRIVQVMQNGVAVTYDESKSRWVLKR